MRKISLLVLFIVSCHLTVNSQQEPQKQGTSETPHAALTASDVSDLQKKAESGDAAAAFSLANAYENGNGVRKSIQQAVVWYRKAAEQGDAKAENSLGVLYWIGDGVEKDKKQAVEWYRKAARQGNANAMFNIGAAYYNGDGVGTVNDTIAFAWFILASEAGSVSGQEAANRSMGEHTAGAYYDACFTIGQMYEKGEDLPRDAHLSETWYRKAADHGQREARDKLVQISIAAKNYGETRHWCEIAAQERNATGNYCLGYLYQDGLGVGQNPKEAFSHYLQGARGSHVRSMLIVAQMYANGEGTKSDRQEAFYWLVLACQRGNSDATREAKKLRSSMTAKEWKETEKKLRDHHLDPKLVDDFLQKASTQPAP